MDIENVLLIFLRAEHSDYTENSENVVNELAIYLIPWLHVCLGKMAQKLSAQWLSNGQLSKLPRICSWGIYSCFRRFKNVNQREWWGVSLLCVILFSLWFRTEVNTCSLVSLQWYIYSLLMHVHIIQYIDVLIIFPCN